MNHYRRLPTEIQLFASYLLATEAERASFILIPPAKICTLLLAKRLAHQQGHTEEPFAALQDLDGFEKYKRKILDRIISF